MQSYRESVKDYLYDNLPALKTETGMYVTAYIGREIEVDVEEMVEELDTVLEQDENKIRVSLYHLHLPRMESEELISYGDDSSIRLEEKGEEVIDWMDELGVLPEF